MQFSLSGTPVPIWIGSDAGDIVAASVGLGVDAGVSVTISGEDSALDMLIQPKVNSVNIRNWQIKRNLFIFFPST
jgi:hypothetical protein